MPRLITARTPAPTGWADRLAERAGRIAQRHRAQQPAYPARWHDARYLWPQFTKGR